MKTYLFVFLSTFLLFEVISKSTSNSVSVASFCSRSWLFLNKFAVAPAGEGGEFKFKISFNKHLPHAGDDKHIEVDLLLYLDDNWDNARKIGDCNQKKNLAHSIVPVKIPADGSSSGYVTGRLDQKGRTRVWFFALSDCDRRLYPHIVGVRMNWELELYNSDRSHFSQEENGVITPLICVMVIIIGFFVSNSIKFYKFYKSQESMDYPTLIVTFALLIEFISLFCETLHLWEYSMDGRGSSVLNLCNQIFSVISQLIVTFLLMLVANGWSINSLKIKNSDLTVPLSLLLIVLHVLIVVLNTLTEEEHYRYHDYESWVGLVIIGFRLLLFIIWGVLFWRTYRRSDAEKKLFFTNLGMLSTLYFLTFPCLVVFSSLVLPAYLRHKVVYGGTVMLQTFILIVFTLLFTSKTTQYYQVSLKGRTLLLSNKLA